MGNTGKAVFPRIIERILLVQHCNTHSMSAVLDLTLAPFVLSVVLHC